MQCIAIHSACLQFVSENKRRMRLESKDEDTTKIKRIYNEISEKFKIKKSDESFIRYLSYSIIVNIYEYYKLLLFLNYL